MNEVIKPVVVESLGEPVGRLWMECQNQADGLFYVATPISNTPKPIYEWVIAHAGEFKNWDKLRFVMMDEQVQIGEDGSKAYVPLSDEANFEAKIRKMFLDQVPVGLQIIKPDVNEMGAFDEEIERHGGLDLLMLAIDVNGQYAQVYPGTPLTMGFHIAALQEDYVKRHTQTAGVAFSGSQFQEQGMSLGPKQVLSAKQTVIIISGGHKKAVTAELLSRTSFDPGFPLSIIYHPKVKDRVKIFLTKDVLK